MTCEECDEIIEAKDKTIYVRVCVRNEAGYMSCSNVAIYACRLHGKYILDALRDYARKEVEIEEEKQKKENVR